MTYLIDVGSWWTDKTWCWPRLQPSEQTLLFVFTLRHNVFVYLCLEKNANRWHVLSPFKMSWACSNPGSGWRGGVEEWRRDEFSLAYQGMTTSRAQPSFASIGRYVYKQWGGSSTAWGTRFGMSNHWGDLRGSEKLILSLKNLRKWKCHAMGPLKWKVKVHLGNSNSHCHCDTALHSTQVHTAHNEIAFMPHPCKGAALNGAPKGAVRRDGTMLRVPQSWRRMGESTG